jgi:hypothetical protein
MRTYAGWTIRWLTLSVVGVFAVLASGRTLAQTKIVSSGVNYGSVVTLKWNQVDQEHFVGSQELMGIRIDDTGKGPLHNLATHIALIIFVDKDGAKVRGYETHSDKDGDKVVWEMSAVDDPQHPGMQNGTGKILAATGKFAGMEGTMTFVVQVMKGFPEGTVRTICKEHMTITAKGAM